MLHHLQTILGKSFTSGMLMLPLDVIREVALYLDTRSWHRLREVNQQCYAALHNRYVVWENSMTPVRAAVKAQHSRYKSIRQEVQEECATQLRLYYEDYLPRMRSDWKEYFDLDVPFEYVYLVKALLDYPVPVIRIVPPCVLARLLSATQSGWVLLFWVTAVVACQGSLRFFDINPYDVEDIKAEIDYDSNIVLYRPTEQCFAHTIIDTAGLVGVDLNGVMYMCGFPHEPMTLEELSALGDYWGWECDKSGMPVVTLEEQYLSTAAAWNAMDALLSRYDGDPNMKTERAVCGSDLELSDVD